MFIFTATEEETAIKIRRKYGDPKFQEPAIIEQGPKSRFIAGRKNMFEGSVEDEKNETPYKSWLVTI